jgi:hypothetical protein
MNCSVVNTNKCASTRNTLLQFNSLEEDMKGSGPIISKYIVPKSLVFSGAVESGYLAFRLKIEICSRSPPRIKLKQVWTNGYIVTLRNIASRCVWNQNVILIHEVLLYSKRVAAWTFYFLIVFWTFRYGSFN